MNEQIKAIRNEIKRLEEIHERNLKKPMERGRIGFAHGVVECCDRILSFIDSLPEEPDNVVDVTDFCKPIVPGIAQCVADHWWEMLDNEEPGCPKGYDESYLNECIAKASKTWEGVDVDKYMDEVRGNRPLSSDNSLEDEMINYWGRIPDDKDLIETARHFALWEKEQMMDEWLEDRGRCFWDGVEEGKKAMKEQMLKEAVEGTVMDFSSNRPRPQVDVLLDPHKYHTGEKVRVIVVKEDKR